MIGVPIIAGDKVEVVARRLTAVARGLVALARLDLLERPREPLYELARRGLVVYRREPPPRERWLCPSLVMGEGWGDCEDLAAWRAAELRLAGQKARVWVRPSGKSLFHAVVVLENGEVEDPSAEVIQIERRRRRHDGRRTT